MTTHDLYALWAIERAARQYFDRYLQDEASERDACICDQQHQDAKTLKAALEALKQ